jgi:uncharacterized phiE125 gp8 family phage protein
VSYPQAAIHLRQDDPSDRDYVNDLIEGCTQDAEDAMACSLLTRTVTAIFNDGELPFLPRGPVQSVTSVTDAQGPITNFTLQGYGNADLLVLPTGFHGPLTVVYQAGYAADATTLPAKFRNAIRLHVTTLYLNRASVSDRAQTPVPHSLELFWQRNNRGSSAA